LLILEQSDEGGRVRRRLVPQLRRRVLHPARQVEELVRDVVLKAELSVNLAHRRVESGHGHVLTIEVLLPSGAVRVELGQVSFEAGLEGVRPLSRDDEVGALDQCVPHAFRLGDDDQPVGGTAVHRPGERRHLRPLRVDPVLGDGDLVVKLGDLLLQILDPRRGSGHLVVERLLLRPPRVEHRAESLQVGQCGRQIGA